MASILPKPTCARADCQNAEMRSSPSVAMPASAYLSSPGTSRLVPVVSSLMANPFVVVCPILALPARKDDETGTPRRGARSS